jgi:hypothetical protein
MRFARVVFLVAGVFGVLAITPMYFLEDLIGRDYPPAITQPVFFYGFVGVGLACQFLFLVLASDPVRYRPMMLPAVVEKFTFGIAVLVLYFQQRAPLLFVGFAAVDLTLGVLFIASYVATRNATNGK